MPAAVGERVLRTLAPKVRAGAWLLVVLLGLGSLVAACGDREAATPTTPNPPAPVSPPPEPPAAPTGLGISATGPDFIEWSWAPVEGVSGYADRIVHSGQSVPDPGG